MNNKHESNKFTVFIVLSLLFVFVLVATTYFFRFESNLYQKKIQSFYETSKLPKDGPLGELVRTEPFASNLQNGSASRILYRTQKADGSNTFSSGLVFVPAKPTLEPRPIVAWAHGTIGMGDKCAPSRQKELSSLNAEWVDAMLGRGWIVVATDYAGLGTPGDEAYLVGEAESNDVLNSIRAVRYLNANSGSDYAIWGHSQGGHSALFSAKRSSKYLPEYKLNGVVASAPAAQLKSLFMQQSQTAAAWAIGPEVAISWPNNYKYLYLDDVITKQGLNNYQSMARECINDSALQGIIRNKLGQKFFQEDFLSNRSWLKVINDQTAPVLDKPIPLMVAESLTDQVVLPNTTAEYISRACIAGSNLTSLWLNDVGHIQLQSVISPTVINWIGDRFGGKQTSPTCDQPLPITPSSS